MHTATCKLRPWISLSLSLPTKTLHHLFLQHHSTPLVQTTTLVLFPLNPLTEFISHPTKFSRSVYTPYIKLHHPFHKTDIIQFSKFASTLLIGRTLARFTQLKRNKRFDNYIMLVWVQESLYHIAAGSHPVQEAWGSQDSLYRGQIQKLLQCCRSRTILTDSSCYIVIQKKV